MAPNPSTLSSRKIVLTSDPAANAEFSATVPAGKTWELVAVSVALVQAGAGSSQPILVVDDGTTVQFESFGSSAAQAVSTTCRYTWAPDLPLTGQVGATTNVHSTAPLSSGLFLAGGSRVRSVTLGLSANTDYSAAAITVVEYG